MCYYGIGGSNCSSSVPLRRNHWLALRQALIGVVETLAHHIDFLQCFQEILGAPWRTHLKHCSVIDPRLSLCFLKSPKLHPGTYPVRKRAARDPNSPSRQILALDRILPPTPPIALRNKTRFLKKAQWNRHPALCTKAIVTVRTVNSLSLPWLCAGCMIWSHRYSLVKQKHCSQH